ncbi:MAG: three-Cys-motif partner protein TcmP [Chloroflexi bacterium]|nr:three-Cys-motif partner protein TcmP [Chloroflexota bacterium]
MKADRSIRDEYWQEYDGLQHAKHQLLRAYLGAWFPILARYNGRVIYFDCHAGRGRHETGQEGSPILALRVLLDHTNRERILQNCQVEFVFFETDKKNYEMLQQEITRLGVLPDGIAIHSYLQDYEESLEALLNDLSAHQQPLAPAFAFVDPFGFTISMNLLNRLLDFERSEVVINFMFRWVDMAIQQYGQEKNMNALFGTSDWRKLQGIGDYDARTGEIITLYSSQLNAKYVTHMLMRGKNKVLKYVLFHATNHALGRERMKDAMWKTVPDGSFSASERDNPNQLILIEAEPDLRPLEDRLWQEFSGKTVDMTSLYEWLLGETYLKKHLHSVITDYRNRNIVAATGYVGRFAFKNNPLINPVCKLFGA